MEYVSNIIKIPTQLTTVESTKNSLVLDGYSLIEQCSDGIADKGTLFLEEHSLFFLLEGTLKLTHGKKVFQLHKGEMILLKKATSITYEKKFNEQQRYDCVIISIKDTVLKNFLASSTLKIQTKKQQEVPPSIFQMPECLLLFVESIKMYLSGVYPVQEGQIQLKMMEMLYNIAIGIEPMYLQLLQFQQPAPVDIRYVMDNNYTSPASLKELSYLSGRSLSAFKRDFQTIFNMPPGQWIREKRLAKAKDLLESTSLTISDICFSVGFENVSHFSRIFKDEYGIAPSSYRNHF